jgi:hypothetical protein
MIIAKMQKKKCIGFFGLFWDFSRKIEKKKKKSRGGRFTGKRGE